MHISFIRIWSLFIFRNVCSIINGSSSNCRKIFQMQGYQNGFVVEMDEQRRRVCFFFIGLLFKSLCLKFSQFNEVISSNLTCAPFSFFSRSKKRDWNEFFQRDSAIISRCRIRQCHNRKLYFLDNMIWGTKI